MKESPRIVANHSVLPRIPRPVAGSDIEYRLRGRDYSRTPTGASFEQRYVPAAEMTITDNEDGTGSVDLQVVDWRGQPLKESFSIDFWVDDTPYTAASDLGVLAATTGTIMKTDENVTTIQTDYDGHAVLSWAATTYEETFFHALLVGKIEIKAASVTF